MLGAARHGAASRGWVGATVLVAHCAAEFSGRAIVARHATTLVTLATTTCNIEVHYNKALAAITGTTILVPYL